MTTNLSPYTVAQAIAELGADRIREAHRYLSAWRVLGGGDLDPDDRRSRLGLVPLTVLRHALEQPPLDTDAMRRVKSWNGRGLAVLRSGKCGNGKTHAAARWMIDGHAAGVRRCSWLAASSWPHDYQKKSRTRQQEWLDVGANADRLVLDDIGSGSTGGAGSDREGAAQRPWSAEPMEGMLMGRIDAGRPTIILTNSNEANLRVWLGARLGSRIQMGGNVWEVQGADLRKPDEVEIDDRGRSPTYHKHAAILAAIGCVRGEDGALVLGGNLERACEVAARNADFATEARRKEALWKPITEAIELLGLDRKRVNERARDIHESESAVAVKFRDDMKRTYNLDVEPSGFTVESAMDIVRDILRTRGAERVTSEAGRSLDDQREAHETKLRALRERAEPSPRRAPAHVGNVAVDAAIEIAGRFGLFVREMEGGTFDVWRQPPAGEKGTTMRVLSGFTSRDQAWLEAALSVSDEIGAVA